MKYRWACNWEWSKPATVYGFTVATKQNHVHAHCINIKSRNVQHGRAWCTGRLNRTMLNISGCKAHIYHLGAHWTPWFKRRRRMGWGWGGRGVVIAGGWCCCCCSATAVTICWFRWFTILFSKCIREYRIADTCNIWVDVHIRFCNVRQSRLSLIPCVCPFLGSGICPLCHSASLPAVLPPVFSSTTLASKVLWCVSSDVRVE